MGTSKEKLGGGDNKKEGKTKPELRNETTDNLGGSGKGPGKRKKDN